MESTARSGLRDSEMEDMVFGGI
ncbi:hypothetical protein Tco_0592023, partial [Tanacetum coccineum]